LHAVANACLDRTIDMIGRSEFDRRLAEWKKLSKQVNDACLNQAHHPCSSDGKLQREPSNVSCYTRDFGCGHPCIDRYIQHQQLEYN
jgi:hypothetical protein